MHTDATSTVEHDLIGIIGFHVSLTYISECVAPRVGMSRCQPSPLAGKRERLSDFEQVNACFR
jgi:hypothetical protein